MPRQVALVQCEKLPLGQFAESSTVFLGDAFLCPCADSQRRLLLVHAFADDCGNELPSRYNGTRSVSPSRSRAWAIQASGMP